MDAVGTSRSNAESEGGGVVLEMRIAIRSTSVLLGAIRNTG